VIDQLRKWHDFAEIVPVSASTGDGVDQLESLLLAQMPESEALYPEDFLTDQPERTLAAETVREKVLQYTRAELPFSTAVVVDRFEEPEKPGGLLRLWCTILVEQESQKPIVIGRAARWSSASAPKHARTSSASSRRRSSSICASRSKPTGATMKGS